MVSISDIRFFRIVVRLGNMRCTRSRGIGVIVENYDYVGSLHSTNSNLHQRILVLYMLSLHIVVCCVQLGSVCRLISIESRLFSYARRFLSFVNQLFVVFTRLLIASSVIDSVQAVLKRLIELQELLYCFSRGKSTLAILK